MEVKDKVDLANIAEHQLLSGNFIREFRNNVSLYLAFQTEKISETFIREFTHKVNWKCISAH